MRVAKMAKVVRVPKVSRMAKEARVAKVVRVAKEARVAKVRWRGWPRRQVWLRR